MFCTSCGASNLDDAEFCVNCGEAMSQDQGKGKSSRPKGLKDVSLLKEGSFLQALFDFSFNHFFTPRIIKVLYGLSIFSAGLIAVLFIIFGFSVSTGFGIFALLIGAPLIFLLSVICSRICTELMIAIFRIAETLANRGEKPEPKDGIEWNV
jgi:Domain of unknown function (DUF4282)/zinc-ribbon domain